MPTHAEKKALPYSCAQMFDLVADVDRYPDFLPWVVAARVFGQEGNVIQAELVVGFKMFREKFTSTVTLAPPGRLDVEYTRGPFKYLNNHWLFEDDGAGGCVIDFYIDFEFHSRLMQRLIGTVFNEAAQRMVRAFEIRAHAIYGEPVAGRNAVEPTPAGEPEGE